MTVYNEGYPRGMWRFGRIEDLKGVDGNICGVYIVCESCMYSMSRKGHAQVLWRPIHHIYPLEVCSKPVDDKLPNE